MDSVIRILLVDDHDMVRTGLRSLLETRPLWKVCGEARTGCEGVLLAAELNPDITVMDLDMPELDGFGATRQIKARQPDLPVVIFTTYDAEHLMKEALDAGASAIVIKSDGGRQLMQVIESLTQEAPVRAGTSSHPAERQPLARLPRRPEILTTREIEILQLLGVGKRNRNIATRLGISVKTVEAYRSSIMNKLEIDSVSQLVRYALRNNLVSL